MLREKRPSRSYHGEQFHTNKTNKKHLVIDFRACSVSQRVRIGERIFHQSRREAEGILDVFRG